MLYWTMTMMTMMMMMMMTTKTMLGFELEPKEKQV
jgi:hypothetical protein